MEACSGGRNWEGFASICNYSRDNIPVPKQFQFQLNVIGCSFEEMWWKKRDFKSFVCSWKRKAKHQIFRCWLDYNFGKLINFMHNVMTNSLQSTFNYLLSSFVPLYTWNVNMHMQFVTLIQVYMFSFDSMFVNNIALSNRTTKLPFDWN